MQRIDVGGCAQGSIKQVPGLIQMLAGVVHLSRAREAHCRAEVNHGELLRSLPIARVALEDVEQDGLGAVQERGRAAVEAGQRQGVAVEEAQVVLEGIALGFPEGDKALPPRLDLLAKGGHVLCGERGQGALEVCDRVFFVRGVPADELLQPSRPGGQLELFSGHLELKADVTPVPEILNQLFSIDTGPGREQCEERTEPGRSEHPVMLPRPREARNRAGPSLQDPTGPPKTWKAGSPGTGAGLVRTSGRPGGTATSDGLAQALPYTEADASPEAMGIGSPVWGLRPTRARRSLTSKVPKPVIVTERSSRSPFWIPARTASTTRAAPDREVRRSSQTWAISWLLFTRRGFCYAFLRRVAFFFVAFFRVPLRLVAFLPAFLEAFRFVFFFAFFVAI
jgi:hypothetical protein